MKKKALWILCLVLLLAAALTVGLIVRNRQIAGETAGEITLRIQGQTRRIRISDLDRETFSGETVNGKGDRFSHSYRGIALKTMLEEQQVDPAAVSSVKAISADQFSAEYTSAEILEKDRVYLAVQMDGKTLEGIEKGIPGVQMVVFGDPDSKRNVRSLSVIEVNP